MNRLGWVEAISRLSGKGEAYVLVTIIGVRGSSPRDSGTKMVVSDKETYATIGGGNLEYKVTKIARQMLDGSGRDQTVVHFPLGPGLGQCCGGSTSILLEFFAATKVHIMLFGAGHVGCALAPILGSLPCNLTWVDSREGFLPENPVSNITAVLSEVPADEVRGMPANAYYIVMTHNHQLDFDICAAILKRGDFRYLGLIGSETKWRRFQKRFEFHGHDRKLISRIVCPVGLPQVPGKQPMEVAVSVAAEVIKHYHSCSATIPENQQGISRRELKSIETDPSVVADAGQDSLA